MNSVCVTGDGKARVVQIGPEFWSDLDQYSEKNRFESGSVFQKNVGTGQNIKIQMYLQNHPSGLKLLWFIPSFFLVLALGRGSV